MTTTGLNTKLQFLRFIFLGIWRPSSRRSQGRTDFSSLSRKIGIWLGLWLGGPDGSLRWRDFSLEQLSGHTGISQGELRKVFQLCICSDFRLWKTSRRMALAKNLLASGMTTQETADRCAYTSLPNFVRQFERAVGRSPEVWLEAFREGKCPDSECDVFRGPLESPPELL